jgi:hypothetical protein
VIESRNSTRCLRRDIARTSTAGRHQGKLAILAGYRFASWKVQYVCPSYDHFMLCLFQLALVHVLDMPACSE